MARGPDAMRLRVILEMDEDARRGLNLRAGRRGLATRDEAMREVERVWSAHCHDLSFELELRRRARDRRDDETETP